MTLGQRRPLLQSFAVLGVAMSAAIKGLIALNPEQVCLVADFPGLLAERQSANTLHAAIRSRAWAAA